MRSYVDARIGAQGIKMDKLQLINDDYKGYVEHVRHACRGILLNGSNILLCYESKENRYIIPGGGLEEGETLEGACEREILEETGYEVKATDNYLEIEELFDNWKHINHYFLCSIKSDTGMLHLTKAEEQAGYKTLWLPLDKAVGIFGRYEEFHATNIADYGLYRREYTALEKVREVLKI